MQNLIGKEWQNKGIKQQDIRDTLNMNENILRRPLKDYEFVKNIQKIADYLGCDVLYMLREIAPPDTQIYITAWNKMSKKQRDYMVKCIKEEGFVDE